MMEEKLFEDEGLIAKEEVVSKSTASLVDKTNKAPNIWNLTWDECLAVYSKGGAIVSWEGYLLAGRDRSIEVIGAGQARVSYLQTLERAYRAGKNIPVAVKESEPELFRKLAGQEAA